MLFVDEPFGELRSENWSRLIVAFDERDAIAAPPDANPAVMVDPARPKLVASAHGAPLIPVRARRGDDGSDDDLRHSSAGKGRKGFDAFGHGGWMRMVEVPEGWMRRRVHTRRRMRYRFGERRMLLGAAHQRQKKEAECSVVAELRKHRD